MDTGIVRIDLHGKNQYQATVIIDAALRHSAGVYRLRLIHGANSGTVLKDMIARQYAGHPTVLRLVPIGDGATDLVLREF